MQLSVVGRHFKVTEPIKKHIDERLLRLEKYDRKIVQARAIVSVEKYRHLAEITVLTKHFSVVGKGQSNDVYTSVDAAMDKIEKQLRKHQERMKEHLGRNAVPLRDMLGSEVPQEEPGPKKPKLIRRKGFAIKPMSTEEARAELGLLKNEKFIVYRNSDTEKVNVIYRAEDGNFGLIEEA